MKNTQLTFRDLLARYQRYTRKLARVWNNKERREFFLKKIEQLQIRLSSMKQASRAAIAGTALAVGMLGSADASAQQFALLPPNPLGLTSGYYINGAVFADLDNDGDYDALTLGYGYGAVSFYENTGTASNPAFAAPTTGPFNLTGYIPYAAKPALVDIDDDGDLDLFVGDYYGNVAFYENTGTATAPSFDSPSSYPFGLTTPGGYYSYILSMDFADMDDDGDFDMLLTQGYSPGAYYYQNDGDSVNAAFALPIPSSLFGIPTPYYSNPAIADIDGDGDYDIFSFEYGEITEFENTGSATTATFAAGVTSPHGLDFDGLGQPDGTFIDLNDDGYVDLAVGSTDGNFYVFYGHDISYTAPSSIAVCSGNSANTSFTASDGNSLPLTVTATSSNTGLLPDANIVVGGTAPNFTVTVSPPVSATVGSVTVDVAVSNGNVSITKSFDVVIENKPNYNLSTTTCAGEATTLQAPNLVVWYDDATGGTPLSVSDTLSLGVLSQDESYYVASIDSLLEIDSLGFTISNFAEFSTSGGDNRGGVVASANYVYFNGDDSILRYSLNMANYITLPIHDGLFSDLATGQIYALWNSTLNQEPEGTYLSGFVVDEIALLDDMLDTISFITLSSPISVGGDDSDPDQGGMYSGEGFLALYSGTADSSVYIIELPSGQVTNLGHLDFFDRSYAENWANWGFATKSKLGTYFLYSFDSSSEKIFRINVQTGVSETVYDFGEVLNDGCLAYAPALDRIYLDWEYDASFFAGNENGGYVEAFGQYLGKEGACREEVVVTVSSLTVSGTVVNETDVANSGSVSIDSVNGGTAPFSYTWSNGETTSTITGLTAGTYDVTVTDANGCTKTGSFEVELESGITMVNSLNAKLYPNPTTGQFYVELNQPGLTNVAVFDLTGREVATANGDGNGRINLNLSHVAGGMYYVHIQQGKANAIKKLVVE